MITGPDAHAGVIINDSHKLIQCFKKSVMMWSRKTIVILMIITVSVVFKFKYSVTPVSEITGDSVTSVSEMIDIKVSDSELGIKEEESMKYILQWTLPDTIPFVNWGRGRAEFMRQKCKFNTCYVTPNKWLLKSITDFDVVAFHGPEIIKYNPGPMQRSPHQKYVFVSIESSHYYPICDKRYDGYFNWTWTYRLDSDEPYRYITVRNIEGDIIGPNKNMPWMKVDSMNPIDDKLKARLKSKKKAAVWIVSNCESLSKRSAYVNDVQNELRKYSLEVDIVGKCGKKKCPKSMMEHCLQTIEKDYYFYFALENSFAEDYVTEKLLYALQHYAVPVVYGAANYTRFMPDGIYLHAGKLSPKQLGKEMNDIIQDKERYFSFFKWHNHYSYHSSEASPDTSIVCKMCEMLHNETLMNKNTVYEHFRTWWNDDRRC